jgi:hypothetical protein
MKSRGKQTAEKVCSEGENSIAEEGHIRGGTTRPSQASSLQLSVNVGNAFNSAFSYSGCVALRETRRLQQVANRYELLHSNHIFQIISSMSFLEKFQQAAHKAQVQATAFSSDFSKQVGTGSQQLTANFTLEKECVAAVKTRRGQDTDGCDTFVANSRS